MTGTERYLVAISAAFRRWADHPGGFWAWLNGEVVAVKPAGRSGDRSS